MENLSASDVALLNRDGNFGAFGDSGFFWVFALLLLAGGGFGGWGNNNDYVTSAELQAGFANQSTQTGLQSLMVETANNNYETAQLINQQTNAMLQQNNTNLINAIQGFNTVNQNIQNQTNVLGSQLMQLSAQLNECCCSIKTQMLENRLDDTQRQLAVAQDNISNYNQSQYLLGQLGRFVAWTPSGTQTTTAG
jgi:hypothetical protein